MVTEEVEIFPLILKRSIRSATSLDFVFKSFLGPKTILLIITQTVPLIIYIRGQSDTLSLHFFADPSLVSKPTEI